MSKIERIISKISKDFPSLVWIGRDYNVASLLRDLEELRENEETRIEGGLKDGGL